MLIEEHLDGDGGVVRTKLALGPSGAVISRGEEKSATLPVRAILLVVRKFGRPLDPDFEPTGEPLELGGGFSLRTLHFRAIVDAEPKLYVVLEGGAEPLCALGRAVAGALFFLAGSSDEKEEP